MDKGMKVVSGARERYLLTVSKLNGFLHMSVHVSVTKKALDSLPSR